MRRLKANSVESAVGYTQKGGRGANLYDRPIVDRVAAKRVRVMNS